MVGLFKLVIVYSNSVLTPSAKVRRRGISRCVKEYDLIGLGLGRLDLRSRAAEGKGAHKADRKAYL